MAMAQTGRGALCWVAVFLLFLFPLSADAVTCSKTPNRKKYKLAIGLLTAAASSDFTLQKTVQETLNNFMTGQIRNCFHSPHYITLSVNDTLFIPTAGWTNISNAINLTLAKQGAEEDESLNVIVGPFYTNLAMILQRRKIPYLVTDYKGFDWIDMSRVQDTTPWATLIEIRPPAQEQNLAVVDLFRANEWHSAVMVMPENAADNQECQNLASQMLRAGISLIPYTVSQEQQQAEAMIEEVLRNAQLFRQWNIIVCSPRDVRDRLIEQVLIQARRFEMTTNKKQVFILVDPSSYLKPMASAKEMYRLGLFSAQCQLLAFRYVQPTQEGSEDVGKAAANDAARVTSLALNNYIQKQKEITDKFNASRFLEELKAVYLPHGDTGVLRFNSTGQRIDYKLHLYNHGGDDMYQKIAEWSPVGDSPGARLNLSGFEEEEKRTTQVGLFSHQPVKIVVVQEDPFVMIKRPLGNTRLEGNDRFEGFTIDLIKRLAEEINFEYSIYISPGNAYGGPQPDGSWSGMVGEILAGNATLAAGAISITSSREQVIDFSLGVLSTGVNILIQKPQESLTIFQFLMPFTPELWMAIVGASAFISIVFFLMDYHNAHDRRFTLRETIWFSVGTLLKRGTDFAPVPVSQRILTAGFTLFVLITVSTYTANMAAFLTTKNLEKSIDSFEALAEDDSLMCGTVRNSATMNFLKQGTKPVFRRLFEKANPGGLVANATEGRSRVIQGGYAFIFDYLINSYSEMKFCTTKAVASPILIQEHGIGMPAGAPFKQNINIELLRLKENGFLQSLKKKWWDDKRTCDIAGGNTRAEQMEFGLEHMAGVFIVGLLGLGAALALFLFKKIYLCIRPEKALNGNGGGNGEKSSEKSHSPPSREKERLCQGQTNTSFV